MDADEPTPLPEPRGSLVPPVRRPPTAIATATPEPPRPPVVRRSTRRGPAFLRAMRDAMNVVLDVADDVADSVAEALGVRPRVDRRGRSD